MNKKIVVLGDIILDQYHFWEVKRLNPESPMPLINIHTSESRLWGAANVAANIQWLWGNCLLIGNIGNDMSGKIIKNLCDQYQVTYTPIITDAPTITKVRYIETTYNQQILRADFEEKVAIGAEQIHQVLETLHSFSPEIIVCSDYTKWVLWLEMITMITTHFPDKILLVDTKPGKIGLYKNVYVYKPNFKEFREMIWVAIENNDTDIEKYGIAFAEKMQTNLIITRGAKWASIIQKNGQIEHLPTQAQKVFDVSGAWDTFLAGIAVKLATWDTLKEAVKFGNHASGIAVSKIGTSIVTTEELFV